MTFALPTITRSTDDAVLTALAVLLMLSFLVAAVARWWLRR